jgi:hypothetical protein
VVVDELVVKNQGVQKMGFCMQSGVFFTVFSWFLHGFLQGFCTREGIGFRREETD